jgi:hypothetical protein
MKPMQTPLQLSEWFKSLTERDFPLPLCDQDFFQLGSEQQPYFCTLAFDRKDTVGPPHYFAIKAPKGSSAYRLFTFWGYGSNSYAFYYTRISEAGEMYLRLPFGGVYMNELTSRNNLIEKLLFYENLFQELSDKKAKFVIRDNMGDMRIT